MFNQKKGNNSVDRKTSNSMLCMQLQRAVKSVELNPVQPLATHVASQTLPSLLLVLMASKCFAVTLAIAARRGRVAG